MSPAGKPTRRTLLLILDGWGLAPPGPGNAVTTARTPHLDRLLDQWPHTELACAGRAVGLPDGFMGNSEVGHMNIGAGRVVYQDMTRIDMAIEDGSFSKNPTLARLMDQARNGSGRLHLMGLVSDGGVHSHQEHLYALLAMAKARGVPEVHVHAFLDGRDTPPSSGAGYVGALADKCAELGVGRIATVTGRYWAMDRDKRYDRVERAWNGLVHGQGREIADPVAGIREAYGQGETDEFVKPCVVRGVDGRMGDGDAVFFFNFRADRARQLSRALFDDGFSEFDRGQRPNLAGFATMTRYESDFPMPAAFPPQEITQTLGQVVSEAGLSQLRIAETEKYAHVTYFFSCGREDPFAGEERVLVPSPREVATYDLKPEMSAAEVTDKLLERFSEHDLLVCNLANLDMVGHTGIMDAAIRAVETVDACVGRIVERVLADGARMLLTADHGNAEEMLDRHGRVQTAHSLNPVPLVLVGHGMEGTRLRPGRLGDLAPTILGLWGLERPGEMTGQCLAENVNSGEGER